MIIEINNIEEIQSAARAFAECIGEHRVFAFYGPMGAGKTTFIRAVCEELGVREPVTSPTFAIVNEYEACGAEPAASSQQPAAIKKIFHFDFYRLHRLQEAFDIGLEDYLYSGHLCFIEWPEIIEELLPENAVSITIEADPDTGVRRVIWE